VHAVIWLLLILALSPEAASPAAIRAVRRNGDLGDCARFRAGLRRALSRDEYQGSETVLRRDSLSDFNDACRDFSELRELILLARATAMRDAAGAGSTAPYPDAEFVKA